MVNFNFTVSDAKGFPTESAGKLVEEAIKCTSSVTIRKEEKSGDAKLIFHVLSLFIKPGQEVEIIVEGEHEQEDAAALETFIREYIV